jgi:hypothetical protein
LTRLTNAYSKKAEDLRAAVALHFAHDNLARVHETLRTRPAVAAGLASAPWSLGELVQAALDAPPPEAAPHALAPPMPEAPADGNTLATWETWRAPVQLQLPGIDDEPPPTERDAAPWWAAGVEG